MILAKMANYRTQKSYTDNTAINQQYYPYPVGLVNFETVTVQVGSITYPVTVINSQFTWDSLNSIPFQPTTFPRFVFPRLDDYGIWPIPQGVYPITFNYHWRDRNLSVADYTIGTVSVTNSSIPFVSTSYQALSATTDASGIATLGQITNPYPNSIFFEIASPATHPAQTITAGNGFAFDGTNGQNASGTVWSSALAYKIVSGVESQTGSMTFPKSQSQAFNSIITCFNGTPSLAVVSATTTKKVNTTTISTTMNLAQLPTVGNMIVIGITSAHGTAPTITDNQTYNTYQMVTSSTSSAGPNVFLYYGIVAVSSGTFTLTVTNLNATVGDSADIFAYEVSGISNVNASTITGSGTTWTPAMVGRWFSVTDATEPGQGYWYRVLSYNSATSLTLFRPWQGNTGSGYTYVIGETPELPEEGHITLAHGVTADFYANLKNDEATAARWENRFWTGDPSNPSRKFGDNDVLGGVIGMVNKYEDRNESHLIDRKPNLGPLTEKAFAIRLSGS